MGAHGNRLGYSRRNCLSLGTLSLDGYQVGPLPTKYGGSLCPTNFCQANRAPAGDSATNFDPTCLKIPADGQRILLHSHHSCRCTNTDKRSTPQHSTFGAHRECRIQDNWRTQITPGFHQSRTVSRTTWDVTRQPPSADARSSNFLCTTYTGTCWQMQVGSLEGVCRQSPSVGTTRENPQRGHVRKATASAGIEETAAVPMAAR